MPDNRPMVSIVMNCLNGEQYLREALDSIYAQTYPNWEIIFWDNASTDKSGKIAQSYDSRLRYFRGDQTIPLGAARKKAMQETRGEYIAFLDVDDFWLPKKLETQLNAMEQYPEAALCYAGIEEIKPDGSLIRVARPIHATGYIFPNLLRQFDVNMVTPLLRKSALEASKLRFDEDVHASEEYNLFMRLASRFPFCIVHDVLGKWRIQEGSLTSRAIDKWASERYRTLDQIRKEQPELDTKFRRDFQEAYARGHYYHARALMFHGKKSEARASLAQAIDSGLIYRILYLSLFFPPFLWNMIHNDVVKRRFASLLFLVRQTSARTRGV